MRILTVLSILAVTFVPASFADSHLGSGMDMGLVTLRTFASPSKEVPAVEGSTDMADVVIQFNLHRDAMGNVDRAIVDYRVNYTLGSPQTITAMHIHRAGPTASGPVVVDGNFGPSMDFTPGSGSFFRQVVIDDPDDLEEVMNVIDNPSGYYFNAHSTTNPAGFIRGQLMNADSSEQALARVEAQLARMDRFLRIMANSLGITITEQALNPTP